MKMTLKETLGFIGTMVLMLICAVIGFAVTLAIGLFFYCLFC